EEALIFSNRKIIDAGVAMFHKPGGVELPVLIAVRPVPLAGSVVRFVGEADGNPVLAKRPELLDEAVVQFGRPLPCEKGNDLRATGEKLGAVAPATIHRVAARDLLRVAGIPVILGSAHFQNRGLSCEWRH